MIAYVLLRVFLILLLVAANAFFAAAEFALVSVRETRIQQLIEAGRIGARTVLKLHQQLQRVVNGVQLGVTVCSLTLGWVGEPVLARLFEGLIGHIPYAAVYAHAAAVGVAFVLITGLHVILGELVPKSLALQRAERVALAVAAPMLDLAHSLGMAALEAEAAFGDGTLYLEKAVSPARHVEIQVLCDAQGRVLTLGERECSIQRRHQKLIEESPSPALDVETREAMEAAAERACKAIGYRNAGTFEFLLGTDRSFYFIELNARLQVEHPVTELVTGIDIVREQLRVAAGEPLAHTGRAPRRGHAIEVRLNAEDPRNDFAPAPGLVTRMRPPLGPGVRLDTHVEDGYLVPPFYDSLLGKLIVWDEARPQAIDRMLRALGELVLEGVPTTRELAIDILRSEEFASGRYSTGFLAEVAERLPAIVGS
jgi:hypothetical protein